MITIENNPQREFASYRDPDGFVFYNDGKVYRKIHPSKIDFFQSLLESAAIQKMMDEGILIQTKFIKEKSELISKKTFLKADDGILQHAKIEFFSFPHEWTTLQLIDAAIFTLDTQINLLDEDLALKDATPYNVQFLNSRPVFIDFTSMEPNNGRKIWLAYNQFLEMFYYPIILKVERNINNKKTFIVNFNGIKVEEAKQMLGSSKAFLKYFLDLGLPYLFRKQESKAKEIADGELSNSVSNGLSEDQKKLNIRIQKYTLGSLKNKIEKIKKKYLKSTRQTVWSHYTDGIHYGEEGYASKKEILSNIVKKHVPSKVIDLGSNTGEFSEIAESCGANVLSIDLDHDCIEKLYLKTLEKNLKIIPIWSELDNPSPDLGWRNRERKSLLKRVTEDYKADMVFALALMHHLIISSRIPLDEMIEFFASLTSKFFVLEYVGPEDKMFIKTLGTRENIYQDINEDSFKAALQKHFEILDVYELSNKRKIYLLSKV